ncbi:MAG: hypothetical protein LBB80_03015 [Treponema sp.]|nr:hypothetical protein [Treponema sp.]
MKEYFEDRDYAVSDDEGWLLERHPNWKSIQNSGIERGGYGGTASFYIQPTG